MFLSRTKQADRKVEMLVKYYSQIRWDETNYFLLYL